MSDWHEYIAAGILHAFIRENPWTPEKLAVNFQQRYDINVNDDAVILALEILSDCKIAFVEHDQFAGQFIKLSRSQYNGFLRNVEIERDPSFEGHKNYSGIADAAALSIFNAISGKEIYRPNLVKYNCYKILRRYHEFGGDFIVKALEAIANRGYQSELTLESDRTVLSTDNQEAYDQSIESLKELETELKTSNEAGIIFGDDREIAIQELSFLRNIISGTRVRVEPAIAFAKKSLGWIAEKAGSAAIGDIAKRALGFLIEWLSR
jgi:hypothetical protein